MIRSVLVANRGEIARRVFRTCRRLGIATVAVYSDADADAPHVHEADQAVRLGPPAARESYLLGEKVIQAALDTGAEAIHPGYGFLSENAEFAEAVAAAGLVWIGPPPSAIRAMGLKDAAKQVMIDAGVPTTPGWLGEDQSDANLSAQAERIGYPVLIKAVAGGGGKGMRRVDAAGEFAAAMGAARRESAAAFGDDRVLIEKYVTRPRHIEVQVFADSHGNAVHLYERDCSLQRRHQKVIEEAPAPGMDEATREAVCGAAVRAALAVGYQGAGTIEFIADASEGLRADRIWFMEMNTRLQVEHPVTEMITGQDLVEWQIRVASGEPLPLAQADIPRKGWAMEARLYAEDPAAGFLPSTGTLEHFDLPEDIRVDAGVAWGGEVSQFYDPMIAKLIVHEDTREAAAARLAQACSEVRVWPIKANAGFLKRCLEHPRFVAGDVDTAFIGAEEESLVRRETPREVQVAALAVLASDAHHAEEWVRPAPAGRGVSPWSPTAGGLYNFRLNGGTAAPQRASINGERFEAVVRPGEHGSFFKIDLGGESVGAYVLTGDVALYRDREEFLTLVRPPNEPVVFYGGEAWTFESPNFGEGASGGGTASDGHLRSPMPGKIVAVHVEAGARVAKGAPLVTLEAMKMEHAMAAPFDGTVAELNVEPGQQVSEGVTLVRLEAAEAA